MAVAIVSAVVKVEAGAETVEVAVAVAVAVAAEAVTLVGHGADRHVHLLLRRGHDTATRCVGTLRVTNHLAVGQGIAVRRRWARRVGARVGVGDRVTVRVGAGVGVGSHQTGVVVTLTAHDGHGRWWALPHVTVLVTVLVLASVLVPVLVAVLAPCAQTTLHEEQRGAHASTGSGGGGMTMITMTPRTRLGWSLEGRVSFPGRAGQCGEELREVVLACVSVWVMRWDTFRLSTPWKIRLAHHVYHYWDHCTHVNSLSQRDVYDTA